MFLSSWWEWKLLQNFFWQAVWQCVLRALKMCMVLPYLLEIGVEIFMNEMMYVCDLLLNNLGGG